MDEVDKLIHAAELIEEMTAGRQVLRVGVGGGYVHSEDEAYFGLNMQVSHNYRKEFYEITFVTNFRRKEVVLGEKELLNLMKEAGQMHALLSSLNMQKFQPGEEQYHQFLAGLTKLEPEHVPVVGQTF